MSGPISLVITNNNLPLLEQLEPLMKARLLVTLEQIGLILEKGAILAIQNQVAPDGQTWAAIAESYVEWKKRQGFSEQIYIMSSSYLQAITHKVEEEELTVVAGVMRDAGLNPQSNQEIWQLAELLEYGSEQFNVLFPARPLWRPLLEVTRHSIQTRIGLAIYWSAKKVADQAKGKVV